MTRVDRLGASASAVMMGWLTVVLLLDAHGSHALQRVLGLLTWGVLLLALRRVPPLVRAQTGVVVAFATLVELVFSPGLHVYVYRFDNVPMYVPPGHGLVYLSAFALGNAAFVRRRLRAWTAAVLVVGGAWAAYGLWLADRPDALGAFWFACLAVFLLAGPSRPVYVGAFVVVTHLELVGTALATWTWQPHDPVLGISIGNPPSGAAGGYAWFDLAGLLAAPYLVRAVARLRGGALSRRRSPDAPAAPPAPVADVR